MHTQFMRVSPIPVPLADGQARAAEYHLKRYFTWLFSAGASPRIALGLGSCDEDVELFLGRLAARDIDVVETRVNLKRAIPEQVLRHEGDHFNRKLFVIDGLEPTQGCFERLDGYADHYAKVATWCLFLVRDVDTLSAFRKWAPRIWFHIKRHILISGTLEVHDESTTVYDTVSETVLEAFEGTLPSSYHGFARLMRSGFGHDLRSESTLETLSAYTIWRDPDGFTQTTERGTESPPIVRAFIARHGQVERYPFVPPEVENAADVQLCTLLVSLHQCLDGASSIRDHVWHEAEQLLKLDNSPDLKTEALFVGAHSAALDGDAKRMLRLLERAVITSSSGSLEARFEADSRYAEALILLESHTDARRVIETMGGYEPALLSPLYDARLRLLKAKSLLTLDLRKANEILDEAKRLFQHHGYPDFHDEVLRLQGLER